MSNETTLVNYLVKKLRENGDHVQRLENKMSSGVPDINTCSSSVETWIEAKYVRQVNKDGTFDSGMNPQQINWSKYRVAAGGRVIVAFRVQGRKELFAFKPWATSCEFNNGKMRLNIRDCLYFQKFEDFYTFIQNTLWL